MKVYGSRKALTSHLSHRNSYEIPRGRGSERVKILKKCWKLNWNFQLGRGPTKGANAFHERNMDVFWNKTSERSSPPKAHV